MNDILVATTLMPDCLHPRRHRTDRAMPARRIAQRAQREQERRLRGSRFS